jgi:hypothetical protein
MTNIGNFNKFPIAAGANIYTVAVGGKVLYDLKTDTGASPDNEYVFFVHMNSS